MPQFRVRNGTSLFFSRRRCCRGWLADDLPLELREGQQNNQGQAPHRGCRVELLRDRNERGALGIKNLDDLGKIGERTGQPVDLVDDHDIDPSRGEIGEQPLQSRPVHKEPIRAAAAVSVGEVGVSADAPSALNPAST